MSAPETTTPEQTPQKPSKPFFRSWVVPFLVMGGIVIGLNAGCQALLNSGGGHSGSSTALISCHNAVKGQLNNPATADFQTFSTTIRDDEITGVVQAQNSFGVPSDITYVCTRSGSSITNVRLLTN